MRTTLDLDDTVLAAARSLAHVRGCSLGQAVSELVMRGLHASECRAQWPIDFSYSPFPVLTGDAGSVVTIEKVAGLRDG
jgi:hypothetical protein